MRQYFKIFQRLLKINFSLLLAYRASFIIDAITTVAWGIFQIVWIVLLTVNIKSAFGWTRDEMIMIAVSYNIIIAIFHCFFSRNFNRFSYIVDRGELDTLLTKPVASQFLASFWIIDYANIFRVIIGGLIMWYLLVRMQVLITLINILGFFSLAFFGLVILYSIWFIVSTLIIWFPRLSNLVDLLYNLNGLTRFPPDMIYGLKNFFLLFLVPFTLTVALPTKALFNKVLSGDIFFLVTTSFILFYTSRQFWKFALRYYTSASS